MTTPPQPPDDDTGRRSSAAGKLAVLGTLALFIIVPAVTITSFQLMQANWSPTDQLLRDLKPEGNQPAFLKKLETWTQTATPVRPTTLRRGPVSSARTDQIFKKLPFDITPEEEALVRATARIAQTPYLEDRQPDDDDRQALRNLIDQQGEHFYPRFILAMWEQTPDAATQAQAALDNNTPPDAEFLNHYESAYNHAPAIILDTTRRPAAMSHPPQINVPPIAFVFDRVRDDIPDTTLILWFPRAPRFSLFPVAYPVYKSIFRVRDAAIPVDQADVIDPEHPPQWLVFPGDIGALDRND
ncbi:hypothetical protein [Mucisphaera calidilacus]|uniref:Uncharacterized protein n=1 Tax=Mucisphaera calidilacus TaxID=2527982 RepID=A0A518BYS4_9BACT|nr:hypothetical protein [Mucisphaera calidilacus]QDU72104.1 hypothetical protein Pan265_19660 [Mucisphaera calidilacus]